MPRRPRDLLDEGYYHLIARGNNRLFIFSVPGGFEMFDELLRRSKEKYEWKLFHYCLMSNHVHLLGQISTGEELPKLMQYLLFEYSRWYRKDNEYVGHLWQGRYKSELIGRESYFLECGRYIERNPVAARMIKEAMEYQHSSAKRYCLGIEDGLTGINPFYESLGRDGLSCQKNYRDYVALEGPYDQMIDRAIIDSYF